MTREVTGAALAPFVEGAADLAVGDHGGIIPNRLPAWARAQHDDPWFAVMARTPAGVALRMATSASRLGLLLHTRSMRRRSEPPRPSLLVVVADGTVRDRVALPLGDVTVLDDSGAPVDREIREPASIEIAVPPESEVVELLLPHDCQVELIALDGDSDLTPAPADPRPRWIHYGSSISHGIEAPSYDGTWPGAAALNLGWKLRNLAFGGSAQLDPFIARMIADAPADVISLKVGITLVNADSMRARTMRPALHGFLDQIRQGHPDTPIVLITAINCPVHESSPGPTVDRGDGRAHAAQRMVEKDDGALTLESTRGIIRSVHAQRNDPHLLLLEGTELFGPADAGHLPDGLHPSPTGLAMIAQRFIAAVHRMGLAERSAL